SPRGPKSPKQSTGRVSVLSPRTNLRTSCVCWRTPTDVLCVLNRQPMTAMDVLCVPTDTHGHTRTATDVMCLLMDRHRQPHTSRVCWRTPTYILCVLNRRPTWAKITQTVHGKGQRPESKDQRADMCTDEQPRTTRTGVLCVLMDTHIHTRTAMDVLCVLTDIHGRPVCADGHTRTA
ncbi:unnamed protein product, partial [Brassica rapa]